MYAIILSGGKQYKVKKGNFLEVESVKGEIGSNISFDKILMLSNDETTKIGDPLVKNAIVKGKIVAQSKRKKIIVFKYKRRKRYRRKYGHRQLYSRIIIEDIELI